MKLCFPVIFLTTFLIHTATAQSWYPSGAPHGRDVSASAMLSPNAVVLGAGFEVAEHFEDLFLSTDYGLGWSVTNADTPTSQVRSIAFSDSLKGYGVCLNGKIIRTYDGGNVWSKLDTVANSRFFKIIYVTPQVLYIAGGSRSGDTSRILKSNNGGNSWTSVYAQPGRWLKAICFLDTLNGFAVGDSSEILQTVNGGTSWTPVVSPVAGRTLNGIAFQDASTGYIIGGIRDSIRTILQTTDAGQNWNVLNDTRGGGLNDITFINSSEGYMVGDSATLLKTTDGGQNWTPQALPFTNSDQRINTISFYNSSFGVIGGMSGYVRLYAVTAPPVAVTISHVPLDTSNVTLIGKVNTYGIPAFCYFNVSTDSTFATGTNWGGTFTSGSLIYFSTNAGNLTPHAKYYYSCNAYSAAGYYAGDTLSFTADFPQFTFQGYQPSSVTDTTAVFNGAVNKFDVPINLSFDYGTTLAMSNSVIASPALVNDTLQHAVTATVTHLQPHTQYYCRMRGQTSTTTYLGGPFNFYTGTPFQSLLALAATNITDSSATISGSISGASTGTNLSFEYGTSGGFGNQVLPVPNYINDTLPHTFFVGLTQLQPFTTYSYRLRAQNSIGIFYSNVLTFFTGNANFVFNTLPATGISSFYAQLNGEIDNITLPVGLSFEFGTTMALGAIQPANPNSVNDTMHHDVSMYLGGLTPATTYYYRLNGNTPAGPMLGAISSFITAVNPEDFETRSATGVTSGTAQLNGAVHHLPANTSLSFEYGTTPSFGNTVTAVPAVVSDTLQHSVTASVTGLQTNSMYYYRLKGVVSGSATVLYGDTMTLYTGTNPIPNWDFQYWQQDTFLLPANWNCVGDDFARVPGHSGNYALRASYGTLVINGMFNNSGSPAFFGGSPFHARPDSITAWLNYNLIPGDTGMMLINMYNTGHTTDICLQMLPIYGSSGGTFKRVSFELEYNSSLTPDSIVIGFFCSNINTTVPHIGDYIVFDDIATVPVSQAIYNADIETWFSYPHKTLLGWNYFKHLVIDPSNINAQPSISQTLFNAPSDYAVELTNVPAQGGWIHGELNNSDGNLGAKSGGFPVHAKHQTFNGYYKWFPENGDTMTIDVVMLYQGQAIGWGYINQADPVTQFTPFNIPITYMVNNVTPDSAAIDLRAYPIQCQGASRLVVDKLSFDGFTGIEESSTPSNLARNELKLYPNPAGSLLTAEYEGAETDNAVYNICDLSGKILLIYKGRPDTDGKITAHLDISGLSPGMYILNFNSTRQNRSSRFVIMR